MKNLLLITLILFLTTACGGGGSGDSSNGQTTDNNDNGSEPIEEGDTEEPPTDEGDTEEPPTDNVDTSPNPFTFQSRENVQPDALVESESIIITDIDEPVAISVSGGEYAIGDAPFTDEPGQVGNDQSVRVRLNASSEYLMSTSLTLTVADQQAVFTVQTTSEPEVEPPPPEFILGSARGVKWKQELPPRGGDLNDKVYGRLVRPLNSDGEPVSFERITTALAKNGVSAVAFRIDIPGRYVNENGQNDTAEMDQYHNELAQVIPMLAEKNIHSYLWIRLWLTNKDDAVAFERFNLFLADHPDAREQVAGLIITEHQLKTLNAVKNRALGIVDTFNQSVYPNYLKSRHFVMPGADNGANFEGINVSDTFQADMSEKVGAFAFSVKTMKAHNNNDPRYADYARNIRNGAADAEERRTYMTEQLHIDDLVAYQQSSNFSNTNHIVYWGDEGDAMTNVHPKAASVLHTIVYGERSRGHFFYATVADDTMELERVQAKSLLFYEAGTDSLMPNTMKLQKWSQSQDTFNQFYRWQLVDPQY